MTDAGSQQADNLADDLPLFTPATLIYLEAAAQASFDRQVEADESVWRSFPFFVAAMGIALAALGRLASEAPLPAGGIYPIAANVLLMLTVAAFVWAFRWFAAMVVTREYVYPAPDAEAQNYASGLIAYHAGAGLASADLDEAVLTDLRAFSVQQLTTAAQTNAANNGAKVTARSQALLSLLVGFGLAFACGTLMFVHDTVEALSCRSGVASDGSAATNCQRPPAADTSGPAADAGAGGRRAPVKGLIGANDKKAASVDGRQEARPAPGEAGAPEAGRDAPRDRERVVRREDGSHDAQAKPLGLSETPAVVPRSRTPPTDSGHARKANLSAGDDRGSEAGAPRPVASRRQDADYLGEEAEGDHLCHHPSRRPNA